MLCLKSSFASHGYDQTKRLACVQMQADISCQFATLSVQNALHFRTKIVQNSSLNSLYLHLQSERKIIIDDELIFSRAIVLSFDDMRRLFQQRAKQCLQIWISHPLNLTSKIYNQNENISDGDLWCMDNTMIKVSGYSQNITSSTNHVTPTFSTNLSINTKTSLTSIVGVLGSTWLSSFIMPSVAVGFSLSSVMAKF